MIVSNNSQSRKKRKFFSRKKIMRGGQQFVAVNSLDTHIYINLSLISATGLVTVNNITNPLVKTIGTSTPGSVILSVDPSLSSLKDYTLFGYNGISWVEIPRENLDMGGNSISLYGNVPGMLIRKQKSHIDAMASIEVSIPVPVNTYGNIMQFVNISTSDFPFTLQSSADTFSSNIYIQLIFSSAYSSSNTKSSGWVPTYIPGLNLWLNASEPGNNTFTPNSGIKVLNWTDKSGQNNHATAQQATAPMYRSGGGGMGMYFNGSTFFSGNISNNSNYSYTFIVARPDISNSTAGRLLSLSAPNTDDSTSDKYMGISATSGDVKPTTKAIVMGVKAGNGSVIKYGTTVSGILSWANATGAWNTGSCSSIAYGMGLFVAVGHDNINGRIRYSTNGIDWFQANMPAPGNTTTYGFYFHSGQNLGGINVVIFTGSIWICGGCSISSLNNGAFQTYRPGLAYSYDGINWFMNTTSLPFTGTGNCITSIATDGNLIILTGTLTPSMNYSYDGIEWFNMPPGVKTATQVGNSANRGTHAVTYIPTFKMWVAGGDAGNTGSTPTVAEKTKIVAFSYDGFNWNITRNSEETLRVPNFEFSHISITRIFLLFINNIPQIIMSGQFLDSRANSGPLLSVINTTGYRFDLTGACSNFPVNGSNPIEVSAAYYDGTNIYYGLQNQTNGSNLIYSTNITGADWFAISGINTPVNVIIDNMGENPNFRGKLHLNNKTTVNTNADTDIRKPYIISSWEDGVNTCVAVNGAIVPSNQANSAKFNISSYIIGKNSGTSYNNYSGYIYEIIAYNVLLYSRSRFAVEGYLAWKWGIQSLLPTSHMYYNSAPTHYSLTTAWPKYFTDLQPLLWLDAQDPNGNESFAPEDRTFISTWYDKSGNKNHLTAPKYSEPMYTTNIIKSGGIQFNRYAYQSMSLIPALQTFDIFSFQVATSTGNNNTRVSTNQPSSWIPGFGAMGAGNFGWTTTYDAYDFMYLTSTRGEGGVFQYDENNNQIRVLYNNEGNYDMFYSVHVSPINGYIYFTVSRWNTQYFPLIILIPNSFPTTTNTNYPTALTPILKYLDWNTNIQTDLKGFGANMFVDKNGNMYMAFFSDDTSNSFYIFPSSNFANPNINECVSTLCIKQIGLFNRLPGIFYSPKNNTMSLAQGTDGRVCMYLDTMATFVGSISGTVLTVESMISGIIILGSLIDIESATGPYLRILTQTSGTTGDVGTYTLSVAPQVALDPPSKKILSILIAPIIPSTTSTSSGETTKDGLLNLGVTSDFLSITNQLSNNHYLKYSYDSITNNLFFTKDSQGGVRIKRLNMNSRQVVTMAACINNRSTNMNSVVKHRITSEKFPIEYGIFTDTAQATPVYDVVATDDSNTPTQYLPLFIGNKYAYYVINNSDNNLTQVAKLSNFRANPSCMFGSLSLTGTSVSMFIVYSNRNSSKNIMPHRNVWNTPIVSLSSTDDFCVFIGGIGGSGAPGASPGTILVITQIISGTLQLGATINTPLGGFIASAVSGTTFGNIGSYNVSIIQSVLPGTTISASNGIGRLYTGNEQDANGPQLGTDTRTSDFISLYSNSTTTGVYRKNPTVTPPAITIPFTRCVPSSGIATSFIGSINTTNLLVTSVISGVIEIGSIINIPGSSIRPIVIGFGSTTPATKGFNGTYSLNISLSVPVQTNMTSNSRATRILASMTANTDVLNSIYAYGTNGAFGTLQVGSIIDIPGHTVKPKIIGHITVNAGGAGTYKLDTVIPFALSNAWLTVSNNPIIPEIVFLNSTPTSLSISALSGSSPATYSQQSATSPSFTPFKVTTIGLGLQPSNMSRIESLLPNYFFDGTICEVIAYNTDLSTNFYRRQLLEGYLAWKWGAQTKLPSTHLYKDVIPNSYVKTAIPCGTLTYSDRIDTAVTVSWPNDNISGIYFFYLNNAVSNSAGIPTPQNSISKSRIININSRSVRLTGLERRTIYPLKVQSVGSESFVETNTSFSTRIYRLSPFIKNVNNKVETPISPFDGPIASARVTNPGFMVYDAYDNLYMTWNPNKDLTYPTTEHYNIRIATQTGNVYSIPDTAPNLAAGGGFSLLSGRIPICVDKTNGNVYWSIYDTVALKTRIYRMTPSSYPLSETNGILNTTWTKLEIANITSSASSYITCMGYSSKTGFLWASNGVNPTQYYRIDVTSSPDTPPTIPIFGTTSGKNHLLSSYFQMDDNDIFYVNTGTIYRFYWSGTTCMDTGLFPDGTTIGSVVTTQIGGLVRFAVSNNVLYVVINPDTALYKTGVSAINLSNGFTTTTIKIAMMPLPVNSMTPLRIATGCADITDPNNILDFNSAYAHQLQFPMAVDSKSLVCVSSVRYHAVFKVKLDEW